MSMLWVGSFVYNGLDTRSDFYWALKKKIKRLLKFSCFGTFFNNKNILKQYTIGHLFKKIN